MTITRRSLLTGLSAALAAPRAARAATVTDGAGRAVPVPAKVERVFPAGPPAAILLYTLAPDLLLGWPRANRPEEREFLLPDIGARPEVGRITGRGNTANLETVLALKPDLILDVGSVSAHLRLARRSRAAADRHSLCAARRPLRRHRRRLPHARRADRPRDERRSLRALHRRHDQDHPRPHRRRCRRTSGRASTMRAGRAGSRPGSAARSTSRPSNCWRRTSPAKPAAGSTTVSIEQVLLWNPDVIVTIDQDFAANVRSDPAWAPGQGGARRPRASVAQDAVRLGRLSALA